MHHLSAQQALESMGFGITNNDRSAAREGRFLIALLALLASLCALPGCSYATAAHAVHGQDVLIVSGTISNAQSKGVKDARLAFFLGGKAIAPAQPVLTDSEGVYEARLHLPAGALPSGPVQVRVARPSYKTTERLALPHVVRDGLTAGGERQYLAHFSVVMQRTLSPALWVAAAVLLAVYVFIAFEMMHRTLAAMVGASVLLFVSYTVGTFDPGFRIISFEDAMHAIDENVIFLLMAMMIIVGVTKKTGVFQWMAYKSFQLARGNIFVLSMLLMFITAVTSAFLDNVTTMLLIIPVTVEIAVALRINPIALLLPEVFASNVGGTATLIGDPPNIMIGSYAALSFVQFVEHLAVVCLIGLAVSTVYFLFWFRKGYLHARVDDVPAMIGRLREEYRITDPRLLVKSGLVLLFTIALFVFHGTLHMEPSVAAMAGASLLLVISGVHIVEMVEQEIEWPTLVFFMMLFIIVAGAEQTGLIQIVANWVRDASEGSPVIAVILVLWVSAIFSAIIDNIPFTATMMPIVAYLTASVPGVHGAVLWWALSLGACLGGNGTLIGASANVVTAGLAEKAGYPITFTEYLRIAFVPMLITVAISMVWLLFVAL
ncbi:MAG TPA: SLC13 family permease [Gammaproteobacteria bacterium]|nr:SLC13 family permease [Gammaproteobacteria bacterium]